MEKKYVYICVIAISLFVLVFGPVRGVLKNAVMMPMANSSTNSYTRDALQNYVVATALSYDFNRAYSDYEQLTMDASDPEGSLGSRFNWRTFNVSPEMANRGNPFAIDCSSFAASVYIYSLGYDFRDYYNLSGSVYTKNFKNYSSGGGDTASQFVYAYTNIGKGINTTFFESIAKKNPTIKNKNSIVVYYKDLSGTIPNSVLNKIKSELQPGDLLVYKRTSGSGHVMVYVGDAVDSGLGFIHATGDDYDFSGKTFGDDDFSIRYDSYEARIKVIKDASLRSIAILRPIDSYCSDDSCTIEKSTSKYTAEIGKLNSNAQARNDISKLRVEQYVRLTKVTTNGSIGKNSTSTKSLSKYNAVSRGDILEYSLYLQNKSKSEFCVGGAIYTTKEKCEKEGHKWKTSDRSAKSYANMKITSKIPANTTFDSCSPSCTYKDGVVTWNVATLSKGGSATYKYKVKVGSTDVVVNEGMVLTTPGNKKLQMAKIETKVNPTFTKKDVEALHTNINKFKELVADKKIKYDGTTSSGDKVLLDNIKSETFTQVGFIKSMYYNTFGIDLSFITKSNVKAAIFDKYSNVDYARKTSAEVSALTNSNYKKINDMLVKGFYGGTYLRGNDALDRATMLRVSDLEVGDIVLAYYTSSGVPANSMESYLYLGTDSDSIHYFARFTKDNKVVLYSKATSSLSSGYTLFKGLYAKDLFVVLRPLQVYGTTVKYNYNGGSGGYSSYTAYSKYRNLVNKPTKSNMTLSLVYNKTVDSKFKTSYSFSYSFGGWYSDSKFTTKVTNDTSIDSSTKYQNLYAKWNTTAIKLPNPTVSGYKFEGWYSNKELTKKVANGGADYSISSKTTLYGKWSANKYEVKYNANGGTGTMSNSSFTYDVTSTLRANNFKKTGYTFQGWSTTSGGSVKYKDKASVSNLTTGTGVVNLYAVWKENEKFTVEVKVTNGKSNASSKSIEKGKTGTFTITPNTGYSSGTVSCTNSQKSTFDGTTLKVTNVSAKTVCTVTYSANKYNIKYNSNGGTGTMSSSVHTYGASKKLSKNTFTRTGYVFSGWALSTSGSVEYKDEASVSNLTTGTNDINLYAKWTANKYEVKYNANGGTGSMSNSKFTYNKAANLSANTFTRTDYTFEGWSTSKDGAVVYLDNQSVKNLTTGTNVVNLYAVWKKKVSTDVTITIKVENGVSSPASRVVTKGKNGTFTLTPNTGYGSGTVSCTNSQSATLNGNSLVVSSVSSNTTCTVKYSVNKYSVKYNANGGTGSMSNSSHTYNKEAKLAKNKFTKNGYKFKGWSLKANGSLEYIDESKVKNLTTGTGVVNLYAIWDVVSYSISYDLDGGTIKNEIKKYSIESNDFTLVTPIKTGYEFVGWTGSNGSSPQKSVVVNKGTYGELNYKANWKEAEYTITYASDKYGKITGITTEKVKHKGNPSGTTKVVNDGYSDLKWAVNKDVTLKDGKTVIKKGDSISVTQIQQISVEDNLVITAYHYKLKNSITYSNDDNGKITGIECEDVAKDGNVLGTSVKANDGYKFAYWIANKNVKLTTGKTIPANNAITNDELTKIIVVEDLEVKAVFVNINYNIIYQSDVNGKITGITKETRVYKQSPSGTSVVSNPGYVFGYWLADKDVSLSDGKIIKKDNIITNDELLKVSITDNITFTAKNSLEVLKVFYKAEDDIKIEGNEVEEVVYNGSPLGVKVISNGDKEIVWTSDCSVVLKDDTKIEAGNEITDSDLKEIVVKENIVLTAKYVENETVESNNIDLVSVFTISGLVLFIGGFVAFLLIKKLKKKKEEI